jgi:mannose-6-phosphate isomerase-like protein (cupin superfamily)
MKSSEIYYILEGTATIHIDKKSFTVSKDDSVYVAPMSLQFIENMGEKDLRFLCIVEPSWKQEDEII